MDVTVGSSVDLNLQSEHIWIDSALYQSKYKPILLLPSKSFASTKEQVLVALRVTKRRNYQRLWVLS